MIHDSGAGTFVAAGFMPQWLFASPEDRCDMASSATLRGERFTFADLKDLFARANEEKSGDGLAGIAARSERERVAAKLALADVTLAEIVANPLVEDEVTRAIQEAHDSSRFTEIK